VSLIYCSVASAGWHFGRPGLWNPAGFVDGSSNAMGNFCFEVSLRYHRRSVIPLPIPTRRDAVPRCRPPAATPPVISPPPWDLPRDPASPVANPGARY
jgi:hypothetical protein